MATISVWEASNLANEVNYAVTGFVLSALGADVELYLFADALKLRWEARVLELDRPALERIVFSELPRLIFGAPATPPVDQLTAATNFHFQRSRDDLFSRLHLRDTRDYDRYRDLLGYQLHELDCLMYNVRLVSAWHWHYCFAIEVGSYPELSIMMPLQAGSRVRPELTSWLLRQHAEHRFISVEEYARPLAQAIQRHVLRHIQPVPVMIS